MPLPLPTLLSQPLVAYTIEFDNEAEHRMPHRTTRYNDQGLRGLWLVSMAIGRRDRGPLAGRHPAAGDPAHFPMVLHRGGFPDGS